MVTWCTYIESRTMEAIKQLNSVVRGEAHYSSLHALGINIYMHNGRWFVPSFRIKPIEIEARDVATGLINLHLKPDELQEWASFILSASSLIVLDKLDETDVGKNLLNALWDLSFGGEISVELIRLAQRVQQI